MELSKRLRAVASLVTEGASVADIGTDHGYIPIYLTEEGIAPYVIAADINIGPLERARLHIKGHIRAKARIEARLSDGLKGINPGEIDTMIAAGMGGGLIIQILSESNEVVHTLSSLILQPQSEIEKVRRYLVSCGLQIVEEDMVFEEGKYYPMMKAVHAKVDEKIDGEVYREVDYCYGKLLLAKKHPVLKEYLYQELRIKKEIAERLKMADSISAEKRTAEIQLELDLIRQALYLMGEDVCG